MNKKINIALVSPSKAAYSETFIQEHKKRLQGNIFYYYGGIPPKKLEGGLVLNSRRRRILDIIKGHFNLNTFSLQEQAVITSFKKNYINLVFAEYGGNGHTLIPVCRKLRLPLIVHFHGYDASRFDQLDLFENYKELFQYAHYIVVVSKKMQKDLLSMGCPPEKIVYNSYGPREEFLEIEPRFQKEQFLFVGRFVNKKAPYYLILAFLEVVKKFPKAQLILAGEGELLNTCINMVKFYRMEKNIKFPGIINSQQFREYLKESRAYVQASITAEDGDSEGTPVSILEASAAGVPVISTVHAGIPDVISNGINGFLVEEHDVMGIANNMITLLEKPDLARRLGEKGKERIKKEFTISHHIKVLNELVIKAANNN